MAGDEHPEEEVARERAGNADAADLNARIDEAWRIAMEDPRARAQISATLGADERDLDPGCAPFRAEDADSGLLESTILIFVGSAFAKGFLGGLGGVAGKVLAERLQRLWNDHFRDRVSPFGSGVLGPRLPDADDD